MKYLKYFESLNHRDPKWLESVETFKSLDVDWWVKSQGASHLGLAYQSILNTDDLDIARRTAEYIKT